MIQRTENKREKSTKSKLGSLKKATKVKALLTLTNKLAQIIKFINKRQDITTNLTEIKSL